MNIKVDKTVLLVAVTKALQSNEDWDETYTLNRIVNILTSKSSRFIHESVSLDEYEWELVENYLEEV